MYYGEKLNSISHLVGAVLALVGLGALLKLIGTTGFWQFTSGLQLGATNFSMIVFFKDQEALQYFKAREMQFAGQAGLAVATFGVAGNPAYNEGVAIITMTRLGLMAEFSYGGVKFTYKELPQ